MNVNIDVHDWWEKVNIELDQTKEKKTAKKWWDTICDYYGQPQRHYHTLKHLSEMFQHLEWCTKHVTIHNLDLVILAVIFHDIVYEPKKGDNEEKSADMFEEYATDIGTVTPQNCTLVKDWILATKSHKAGTGDNNDDEHYFLDMDMAVLGRDPEDYDEYAAQIRKEYIDIPEQEYRIRRSQILEDFGKRLPLFSTKLFRDKLEEKAKTNLAKEISRLRNDSIPL